MVEKGGGFTLIELLIVVVILSTLAAMVAPHFGAATESSGASATAQNAFVVQKAVDRFHADHGFYPGPSNWGKGCSGYSRALYAGGDPGLYLRNRLAVFTDAAGTVCDTRQDSTGAEFPFGPYLRKQLPINPLNGLRKVYVNGSDPTSRTNLSRYGWVYNYNSGSFSSVSEDW